MWNRERVCQLQEMSELLWLFDEHNGSSSSLSNKQNQQKVNGDANIHDDPDAGGMI